MDRAGHAGAGCSPRSVDLWPAAPDDSEKRIARQIAEAIGYLPLALELAARYLARYEDVSFSVYLGSIEKNPLDTVDIQKLSVEELATRHEAASRAPSLDSGMRSRIGRHNVS